MTNEIHLLRQARALWEELPMDTEAEVTAYRIALSNAQEVIHASLIIERMLKQVIAGFLFSQPTEKREFFESTILSSDWFTLAAKRRVVMAIVNRTNALQGKQKQDIDELTGKVMRLRNAFTHGEIVQTSQGIFLHYFEGQLQQKQLTDAFWEDVDRIFDATYNYLCLLVENLHLPVLERNLFLR